MCTRFVYRGDEVITGFNFDIDLDVWDHKIIKEKDCFYIGILRPDGMRHSYHGVNRNGNVETFYMFTEIRKESIRMAKTARRSQT